MQNSKKENRIAKVCVYSDRALVTREVSLSGIEGAHEYIFPSLPPGLARDSLRVRGEGDFIVMENDLTEQALEKTNIEEFNKIYEALLSVEDGIKKLDSEKEARDFVNGFLGKLPFQGEPGRPADGNFQVAPAEVIRDFFNLLTSKKAENTEALEEILSQKEEMQKSLTKLNNDKAMLQESARESVLNCRVAFKMNSKGDAVLRLTYLMFDAYWSPLYDARLLYKERELELVSYAEVSQSTGEAWSDVALSLSTANPVTGAHLDKPAAWFIDLAPLPPPQEYAAAAPKSAKKMFFLEQDSVEYDRSVREEDEAEMVSASIMEEPPEAEPVNAEAFAGVDIETSGLNVTFTCGASCDIPFDGSTRKVFISQSRFPVEYEYIIMPSVEEAAYLKVSLVNNKEYPILKGPVKVFRGFDFIGDSELDDTVPGEKLELFMGIDDRIKVKREILNRFEDTKGFSGKDKIIEYKYKLEIESFKDTAETLSILEQVPVSINKEIEVEVKKSGGFQGPDEKGILKMKVRLEPGQKKDVTYSYTIRYPAEMQLEGLPG